VYHHGTGLDDRQRRSPVEPGMTFAGGHIVRLTPWTAAALVLALAPPASAQDWENFLFVEDGFEANFPGRPQVERTTWITQYGYEASARVYRGSRGNAHYAATVVDYRGVEQQGVERARDCHPDAEPCLGTSDGRDGAIMGLGYWKMDVRGAPAFATLKLLQRGATVIDFNLQFQQVVEGYLLRLTNPDESRTLAYITMHENRLYIFEGTTPKGYPDTAIFQSSVGFVDADGNSLRYLDYYSNAIHGLRQQEPPPVTTERSGALVGVENADPLRGN
jgi:hypothetical protein